MSLHIGAFTIRSTLFSNIQDKCNEIIAPFLGHKIKDVKNNSIIFVYNKNKVILNKKNIINDLLKTIKTNKIDLEEFKNSERTIQISSTINKAIDTAQSGYLHNHLYKDIKIQPIDKKEIFKKVQCHCNLKDAYINTNAAQTFIKQYLLSKKEINNLIQSLTEKSINRDMGKDVLGNMSEDECRAMTDKINSIRKDITVYVIEKLNAEICNTFFSDINFNKISQYANKVTNDKLENKQERQMICNNIAKTTSV